MATETLLEPQIDDGEHLIKELVRQSFEVTTAFWIKSAEDSQWYLYIASPVVATEGLAKAYRKVHSIIRGMHQPFWIDAFDVKLVEPTNPVAQEVLAVHRRYPGKVAIKYKFGEGKTLADLNIEGSHLYPLTLFEADGNS